MADVEGAVAPAGDDTGAAPPPTTSEPADEPRKIEDDLTPEPEALDEGTEDTEPDELEEDIEEFDWNGKKIKGPKGLKDGVLMQADYTRKTQEVADQRKALEADRQRLIEQAKASDEDIKLRADYMTAASELEQYRNVDWTAWIQQDPIAAQQGFVRQQTLERSLADISRQYQERTTARTSEAQQDFAKRMEETQTFAQKNIKGWTPETDRKVIEYALEQGVALPDLQAGMNPTIYKILHRAMLGEQVLNKPAAANPPPNPSVAPLETVAARANPPSRLNPEDMTMEQYAAWRAKGGGTRRS